MQQDKILIGLGYRARSGKDTVGNMLHRMRSFHRVGLSTALKAVVSDLLEVDAFDDDFKEASTSWGMSGGQALQLVGMSMRTVHQDVWIKAAQLEEALHQHHRVVVTDVRFKNEAAYIKSLGGILVQVWRPGLPDDDHVSEREGRDIAWDYTLANDGTLDQLYGKVEGMMKHYGWA